MNDSNVAPNSVGPISLDQAKEEGEILPSWLIAEEEASDEALEAAAGTELRSNPLKLTYAPWRAWCLSD